MLEPLRRGTADILYAENDGVVIYERNSRACMVSMEGKEKFKSVIDVKKYRLFAVHQKNIADFIQREGEFSHMFEAWQAAYNKKEAISGDFDSIKVLSYDFAEQICENDGAMNDKTYIENLIGRGCLWGIFEKGALAGFIGEHLEGSMGLLEVLPEYRMKGYGEAFLINRFLRLNETPFCQVTEGNAASLALQQKLGMDISEFKTAWIF